MLFPEIQFLPGKQENIFSVIYTQSIKMPNGGAWSNSNRSRMMSNVNTTQNQGGGEKKAGFPYQIGRDSWSSIFLHTVDPIYGRCCKGGDVAKTMVFTKNTVRPTNSDPRIRMR